MRNKIARKTLLNIQQVMEFEKFVGGNYIFVRNIRKRVPAHIEKIYGFINQAYLKQKTEHNALCKVIETLIIAESRTSILRPKSHQDFYDKMTYIPSSKVYNLNLDATIDKMMDYFNSAFPAHLIKTGFFSRNIHRDIEKLKKMLIHCIEQKSTPGSAWGHLKKVLIFANSCVKKSGFTERERNFLKRLCKFMVFNEPKKSKRLSIDRPDEPAPPTPETIEATNEVKKAMSKKQLRPDVAETHFVSYESSLVDVSMTSGDEDESNTENEYDRQKRM